MKKIIILLLAISLIALSQQVVSAKTGDISEEGQQYGYDAQFISYSDEGIPVYSKPLCYVFEYPIDTIHQVENCDTFCVFRIIEQSPLRFKIAYNPKGTHTDTIEKFDKFGWVDKKNIGYAARSGHKLRLYENPDETSDYIEFDKEYVNQERWTIAGDVDGGEYVLLDLRENGFRKVMFYSFGKLYTGWIINKPYNNAYEIE